jgi:PTH2 family peptidyl-tRNA hydrolase
VVRRDLRMGLGKAVAQGAHAAVAGVEAALTINPGWVELWRSEGMPKIALRVDSLADLEAVCERAERAGLPVILISDAGHTQLAAGTVTCAAIGPAPAEEVDAVTSGLRLL